MKRLVLTIALLLASCAPPPDAVDPSTTEAITSPLNGVLSSEITNLGAGSCGAGSGYLAVLNRVRTNSNPAFGCVGSGVSHQDSAAQAHAWYITANAPATGTSNACLPGGRYDQEASGCTNFTGVSVQNRFDAQGGASSAWKAMPEVANTYAFGGLGQAPVSETEIFAWWVHNPYTRVRLLHGGSLSSAVSYKTASQNKGAPASFSQIAHVLEFAAVTPWSGHDGPQAIWPPAGQANVPTSQVLSQTGALDPNGGGVGYAFSMVNETYSQLHWKIERMCFMPPVCSPGQACWDCPDQAWSDTGAANGFVQVLASWNTPSYHPSEVSFYTPDPLTANRRYRATVRRQNNATGAQDDVIWEVTTQ